MTLPRVIAVQGESYCTPVVNLKKNSREICLVGVSHWGFPSFYEKVQVLLDSLEGKGWLVTHEGANWSECLLGGTYPGLTPEESETWRGTKQKINEGLKAFGLIDHVYATTARPTWVFTDSESVELTRRPVQQLQANMAMKELVSGEQLVAKLSVHLGCVLQGLMTHYLSGHISDEPKLKERDVEATDAILQFAQEHNVVSCWGAIHLPGITKPLLANGLEITKTEWWPCLPTTVLKI